MSEGRDREGEEGGRKDTGSGGREGERIERERGGRERGYREWEEGGMEAERIDAYIADVSVQPSSPAADTL